MIRILVSTILSFSMLTASNITAGNAGEILKGSQTSTLSINKFDSAPDAKLSKSESKEKSVAAKSRASALKKDMDTKINIAKKVFTAKTKKNSFNTTSRLNASDTDPSFLDLKIKRAPSTNVRPKINRNPVNTQSNREMIIEVPWTGTPGEMETFIMADTLPNGEQVHDVYMLQANKVYLQLSELALDNSCSVVGGDYDVSLGEHPATVQPIEGADGQLQFTGWPQNHIKTYGSEQHYEFRNILFNGVAAGQTHVLFGVLSSYGERNTIVVDGVTSVHHQVISYFNFGYMENIHLINNTAVQYTSYPGGMYWGGFFWGGGSWAGTLENLVIQNNTIEGTYGQAMVLWDNVVHGGNPAIIDHNTFVNVTLEPKFYRGGNNTLFTNNLFVNTQSNGQTHNSHGQGPSLNWPGGHGKMSTLWQSPCTDPELIANGHCWDNYNRNIHYENNAWFDTEELTSNIFSMDPWCWDQDVYDDYGDYVGVETYCDTMIGGPGSDFGYNQSRWMDDSTMAQMPNGVSEINNLHAVDLGFNLQTIYIQEHVERNMDYLDNKVHDNHLDYWWLHQADGDWNTVEWPLPMDFSYSTSSAAYTHAEFDLPVGNLNVYPDKLAEWEELNTPIAGVEFEYSSVADLFADFEYVLHDGAQFFQNNGIMDQLSGNLGSIGEYIIAAVTDGYNDLFMYNLFEEYALQYGFQNFYFQFKDDNGNMMYDDGEIYAVSCENGENGEMHTISWDGTVYDLDFMMFWWMAYDFEFYPNDGDMEEFWIFDGQETPLGWEIFQWGNASLSVTDGSGMYENSGALTFIQGDSWSGGGFNIAPPLYLGEMWSNGALMFWMWSEPDAPTLRLQFEDGPGKVGMHFDPVPEGGWNYYGFRLEDFYFIDGSTDFNEEAVTVFQVMAEGNGVAGRTFHFDEMYIGETEDDGGEPIWFDFVGDMDGHWYFVSQEPMSWHDGLNFTDTVDVGMDMIHLATITSQEENDFVKDALDQGDVPSVWLGLTDEYEEGAWQWVTGEPVDYTNWVDGEPNNSGGTEHYAEMYSFSGEWNDANYDFANRVLIEYIPNQAMNIAGEWQMAPFPGSLRVGPEPFNGDWWQNSVEDVQARACYFDDRYVFDESGFHNDLGDETWIEFWQGGDYNGDGNLDWMDDHCGVPMYPHDGSSNPAGFVLDEAAGTLTLNGLGAYIGLPKAANGFELASPDEAPESVTYQVYMQESPRMMTLVIEVGTGVFWTFDLIPTEPVYFAKEDYADVTDPDNWDHVTPSVAIMRGDNQGLYNPYVEDSYNGLGPSGTLWSVGYTSEADPMGYMEWSEAIGGQAANLPGQTLSMWCLAENLYFDIEFESWTNGNNGGGFSYWRTFATPPAGPTMHLVWGMMGSDETGDGSFENPFATIGHAMANMNNNDWIVVGPGVYEESLSSYEMSGLLLSFAGPDSTFISGSGQNRIMEIDYGNWMIGGFTFSDGNTDGDGAAIKIHDGSIMVGDSRFVNNIAEQVGGAVVAVNADVVMDSVFFIMNHSTQADGGGLFIENNHSDEYRNVSITNSVFAENTANGQGAGAIIVSVNNAYTDAYLDRVEFLQNAANSYSGYRLFGNVWSGVSNSVFAGNQAQAYTAGGGAQGGAYLSMDYCLIAGNQANLAGGTHNSGGFSVWGGSWGNFYQCTFVGNSAEYGSALTVGAGSGASVDGSIVWNNPGENALAAIQWDDNGSNLDVYHSVVQGGESGMYADDLSYIYHDGVLDMDPFFCDPANGDFSLDVLSHAVTPWGEPMGALGYGCEGTVMASASILSVEDVPNDQGGRVYVTFEKSLFDTDGLGRTEMYTVERMDGDQWVGLTSVGAYASEVYVVEVTTLADSTSEGDAMTTYRVVANMDEGNFESESASGYSVDNIAPMMVTGLNAEVADGMVMLSWSHSEANDFSHYMVYYSTVADFIPSEETMIGTHSLPSFEHNVEEMGDHYYVVSAVDIHENESEYSEAVNVTLLSLVDVHGLPETFALHQNYPNPFNPSTTIRYDLPEASNVSLIIYDMMGREVTTLMSGQVDAGYHFIQWDGTNSIGSSVAAGVYIYTIQAGKHRDVNKMIYLK